MKVKLISSSKPSRQLVSEGLYDAQELIAYCARVSNPSNQMNMETADKLIKYLVKHKHWSPLEMVSACLEIETTRDIEVHDNELQKKWQKYLQNVINEAKMAYAWAIENGIAKEQARAVLPEGNTVSRIYMNGTLRSWVHYIELRSEGGTQKEHREIAVECAKVIAEVFPLANEFVTK